MRSRIISTRALPIWLLLGSLLAQALPCGATTVDVSVARLYIGEAVAVEGRVNDTRRDGNIVQLFIGEPPEQLVVSIIEGLLTNFPQHAEQYYNGKQIRVGGIVREFRGQLEITVRDAHDIQVIEPGRPDSTADQLRIQQLERRVKELESAPSPVVAPMPGTAPVVTAPAPAAAPQVDGQEERLKKMEFRVRQLERELHKKR